MAAEASARSVAFAKTTRPAIGSIAPRERLIARMDGAPGRTVVWISGPPGAGKTTLAASYLEARGLRCLWYQVDPDDADAATLFHYLSHAARKLDATRAKELPKYSPQAGAEAASFARRYFRQLFGRVKGPFALVFDNLNAVPPDGALHGVLESAFAQVPKHCAVIVTSRSEPPAGCARMRVTGEMICIGPEDLPLDDAELGAVAELRGQALDGEAVAALRERTQGWAAGIVLMLEHAKRAGRAPEPPRDAAPQVVFDYLAGEIFERFEPKMREFLMRIACLPRMTAVIAQALANEPKAARLLLSLALNHYFVSEVQTEAGRAFQLHPLLREFLRARAALELPEALSTDHLRRAADLLLEAGHADAAVSLLVEIRDWTAVARVAAEQAEAMFEQGRAATLASWLDALPRDLLQADPRLLVAVGACRSHDAPRVARRAFEQAFEGFCAAGDDAGAVRSAAGVVETTLLEFDDLTALDRWIAAVAERHDRELAPATRLSLAAACLWRGVDCPQLETWLRRESGESQLGLAVARAMQATLRGDPLAAARQLEQPYARVRESGAVGAIAAGLAMAVVRLAGGQFDASLQAARAALAQAETEGLHRYDRWLRAAIAAAALSAGDRDAARSELQRLEAEGARSRRGDRVLVHYLRGWLSSVEGDAAGALREARSAQALAAETGIAWLDCLARAALARELADAGDRRGAETQARASVTAAQSLHSPWLRFSAQLAAAEAALGFTDPVGLRDALTAAFALGREHGLQHAPWWRAREVANLCAFALGEGVEPEFARTLARARALAPRVPPLRLRDWPWAYRISTLGRFELLRDAAPVDFGNKGPGRPLELLKLLVALGGQNVRADLLGDALWPHVDADYAHKSFTATLHRLRRLLGNDDALVLRDARLTLNPALVWVDAWALEAVIAALDDALRLPPSAEVDRDVRALTDELFTVYRGPFLADESEQPGFIACREQLRARLLRCLARVARHWEESGQPVAAADAYLRCIDADHLFESPYRNLMLCYRRSGDVIEARATYERLRTIFAARLKRMPSEETQAVLASLERPAA